MFAGRPASQLRGSWLHRGSPETASMAATCPRAVLTYMRPSITTGTALKGPGRTRVGSPASPAAMTANASSWSAASTPPFCAASSRCASRASTDSQVQTTSTWSKLSASIWSRGEYLLLPPSLPKRGQSTPSPTPTAARSSVAAMVMTVTASLLREFMGKQVGEPTTRRETASPEGACERISRGADPSIADASATLRLWSGRRSAARPTRPEMLRRRG